MFKICSIFRNSIHTFKHCSNFYNFVHIFQRMIENSEKDRISVFTFFTSFRLLNFNRTRQPEWLARMPPKLEVRRMILISSRHIGGPDFPYKWVGVSQYFLLGNYPGPLLLGPCLFLLWASKKTLRVNILWPCKRKTIC